MTAITEKRDFDHFFTLYEEVLDQFGEMEKFMLEENHEAAAAALKVIPDQLAEMDQIAQVSKMDWKSPDLALASLEVRKEVVQGQTKSSLRGLVMVSTVNLTFKTLKMFIDAIKSAAQKQHDMLVEGLLKDDLPPN